MTCNSITIGQQSQATITAVTLGQDNLAHPEYVSILVIGTGNGAYRVTDNGNEVMRRTLVNGQDFFVLTMSLGSHTVCCEVI